MSQGLITVLLLLWAIPGFFAMYAAMMVGWFGRLYLLNLIWIVAWPILLILMLASWNK